MRKDKQEFLIKLFKHKRIMCTREGDIISFSRKYPIILKPTTTKKGKGYKLVRICSGEIKDYLVHQIVYLFFKGSFDEKFTINHIDGNKLNNNIDNLELATMSGQIVHAHKLRLINQYGEKILWLS